MTERQTCVRRYACPACGRTYGFDRLKGTMIRKHKVSRIVLVSGVVGNPHRRQIYQCPGSGMLPVRAKAVTT